MTKPAKKRIGRPPGRKAPHRPVVSARVPQGDYDQIKAAARASGRTMAEEIFFRVRRSFEDERRASALAADARESMLRHAAELLAGSAQLASNPNNPLEELLKRAGMAALAAHEEAQAKGGNILEQQAPLKAPINLVEEEEKEEERS